MPTPILNHNSPYFTLFHHHPYYSFLHSFGCTCFPLLRPYNSHKLSFRSKKCIFLGYSANQKGYRCLDPLSNCVYISRHVVFDETQFPGMDTIAGSTPQAKTSLDNSLRSSGNSLSLSSIDFVQNNSDFLLPSPSLSTTDSKTSPLSTSSPTNDPQQIHSSPNNDNVSSKSHTSPIPIPIADDAPIAPERDTSLPNITHMVTRSQTHSLKPKSFPTFTVIILPNTHWLLCPLYPYHQNLKHISKQ